MGKQEEMKVYIEIAGKYLKGAKKKLATGKELVSCNDKLFFRDICNASLCVVEKSCTGRYILAQKSEPSNILPFLGLIKNVDLPMDLVEFAKTLNKLTTVGREISKKEAEDSLAKAETILKYVISDIPASQRALMGV